MATNIYSNSVFMRIFSFFGIDRYLLKYASDEVQKNIIRDDPSKLESASDEVKNNEDFVQELFKKAPESFFYASSDVQNSIIDADNGKLNDFTKRLEVGRGVNDLDEYNKTLLTSVLEDAVQGQEGCLDIACILIRAGGKFSNDAFDDLYENALMLANSKGHKEIVEHLVSKGAYINAKDKNGFTALIFAAFKGHKEIVEHLVSKGADINVQDNDGVTALMLATFQGYKEIVEYLVIKGANINSKDSSGETALMWAVFKGYKEIVEHLVSKGANINAKDSSGQTVLMCAVSKGYKEIVEHLVSKGANINAKDKNGHTALMLAASKGHKEIVEHLVSKGANINAKDKNGHTALMFAASKGHKEIVEHLVSKGANINAKDKNGYTAVTLAGKTGHHEIESYLSDQQVLIDDKSNYLTGLMLSISRGIKKVLSYLVGKSPNINNKDISVTDKVLNSKETTSGSLSSQEQPSIAAVPQTTEDKTSTNGDRPSVSKWF